MRSRYSGWSGELPGELARQLRRTQIKGWCTGPPDHVGWVPARLGSSYGQQLVMSGVEDVEQLHVVLGGEWWHCFHRHQPPWRWVIAVSRPNCPSPVWWGCGGAELWREITDLMARDLEELIGR